jgi:hypothetical protein
MTFLYDLFVATRLLLPRHYCPHFCLFVLDQFAANIHGHAVDLACELKRRLVVRCDWRSVSCAAGDAAVNPIAIGVVTDTPACPTSVLSI